MALYGTLSWRRARRAALARDGHRCSVSRLLGGDCSPGPLDVHHLRPLSEGGDPYALDNLLTACDSHHPILEALRRRLLAAVVPEEDGPPACRHRHPTAEARSQCEARLRRRWERQRTVAA